jgi:hypothetical protein
MGDLRSDAFGGRRRRYQARASRTGSAFVGIVLVGIGSLLLLQNLGIFRFRDIFQFWPLLPIAWGAQAILRGRSLFAYVIGGLAIGLGALKLLDNLDIIEIGSRFYAPVVLIALGIAFLARNFAEPCDPTSDATTLPQIHPIAVFGGVKRRVESQEFEGGEVMAVFGGVELDFRRAKIKGESATIETNALFGGCQLRVPETWVVEMRGVAMFGGYEDKTITPRHEEGVPVPKLIITGNAIFGGVSVEN